MKLEYNKIIGEIVKPDDTPAIQAEILEWAAANPMPIKKQATKNKLGLVYTITGESPLNKLYTKHMDMELCEKSVKSYVINLNKNKYKNLDWIS